MGTAALGQVPPEASGYGRRLEGGYRGGGLKARRGFEPRLPRTRFVVLLLGDFGTERFDPQQATSNTGNLGQYGSTFF